MNSKFQIPNSKIMEMDDKTSTQLTPGHHVHFRALGTTYKVMSDSVDGSSAIVEHTLEAKSIGAPMHKHTREDEISYVLEGTLSVIQDGVVQTAGPGEFIVKARNKWHTFWNATDAQVRFLEIIIPGAFEGYYAEIAPFLVTGQPPQFEKLGQTAAKYGLMMDPPAAAEIIELYGLNPPG